MPSRSKSSPLLKGAPAAASVSSAGEQIIAGARAHFLTHGFRNVTMDDLAAELGMSKKPSMLTSPASWLWLKR